MLVTSTILLCSFISNKKVNHYNLFLIKFSIYFLVLKNSEKIYILAGKNMFLNILNIFFSFN